MPAHLKILRDEALNAQLEEVGYIVTPFLNSGELERLVGFYNQTHTEVHEGLHASISRNDAQFRKEMIDTIRREFARAIENVFVNCSPIGGTFFSKSPGQQGVLYPHQDSTVVEEELYPSFQIWVPLVDTTPENGGISVLKRSHKLLKTYRGAGIRPSFENISQHLLKHMEPLNIKAGEALVYNHQLLHASGINRSKDVRVAVIFIIIPSQAPLRYFCRSGEQVEMFESVPEFYYQSDPSLGPAGLRSLGKFDYDFRMVTEEQFDKMYFEGVPYESMPNLPNKPTDVAGTPATGLLGKLFNLLKR